MKLGTESKGKVAVVVILGAIAIYGIYSNFFAGPDDPTPQTAASKSAAAKTAATGDASLLAPAGDTSAPDSTVRSPSKSGDQAWHPALQSKRKELRPDVNKVDPTLRLDLLAKLEKVPPAGSGRNLFQTGPKPPDPKDEPTVAVKPKPVWGPRPLPPPPPPPGPKVDPPEPPVDVKYYGYASPAAVDHKRAFFMDGEQILIKAEGETFKGHYKVVRITPDSVTVENTNNQKRQEVKKVEGNVV